MVLSRRLFLTSLSSATVLTSLSIEALAHPLEWDEWGCIPGLRRVPVSSQEVPPIKRLEQYVHAHLDEYVKEGIFPIIKAEAISAQKPPQEMRPVAEKVKQIMSSHCLENLQILQVAGSHPAVYGEIRSSHPYAPTILIQGHYDGQPSTLSEWTPVTDRHGKTVSVSPHQPVIVEEGGERRIYGRGSSDDWGQVMTHLAAVDTYCKTGTDLPVNIKFLIEGGEETGSTDMNQLIEKYKDLLKTDVVMITDSAPGRADHPVITTTSRGLVGATITLNYGTNSAHSGDNIAPNPVQDLSELLQMRDPQIRRVTIPGFYDDVVDLSPTQREKMSKVPFDIELFKRANGLRRIVTEQGYSAQETMWTRPSYEVHYIDSIKNITPLEKLTKEQYQAMMEVIPFEQLTRETYEKQQHRLFEEQNVNKIPYKARAYVTMRIVPNQRPEIIWKLFLQELQRRAARMQISSEELEIEPESLAHPFTTSTESPFFKAAEEAMQAAFGNSVDYMGCGGTEPIALHHQQILKVPVIFNAYNSQRDHYHGSNESLSIEKGFLPGIIANILFYQKAAGIKL